MSSTIATQTQIPFVRRYNLRPRPSTNRAPPGSSWTIEGDNILVTLPSANGQGVHMRWIHKGADGPYRVALDGENLVIFGKDATYLDVAMKWFPRQSVEANQAQKPAIHVDVLRTPSPAPTLITQLPTPDETPRPRGRQVMRDVFITPDDHRNGTMRPPMAPRRDSSGVHPLIRQNAMRNDEMEVEDILAENSSQESIQQRAGLEANQNGSRADWGVLLRREFDEEDMENVMRVEDKRLLRLKEEESSVDGGVLDMFCSPNGEVRSFWELSAVVSGNTDVSQRDESQSVTSGYSVASTEIVMNDEDNGSTFFNSSVPHAAATYLFSDMNRQSSICSDTGTEIASNNDQPFTSDLTINVTHEEQNTGEFTGWPAASRMVRFASPLELSQGNFYARDQAAASRRQSAPHPLSRIVRFDSPLELSQGNIYARNEGNTSRRLSAPQSLLRPPSDPLAMAGPGPSSIANIQNRVNSTPAQREAFESPFFVDRDGKMVFRQPKRTPLKDIFAEFTGN